MCIDMGMMTWAGVAILTVAIPAVPFSCGTAAPLAERFRDLNMVSVSPISYRFKGAKLQRGLLNKTQLFSPKSKYKYSYILAFLRRKSIQNGGFLYDKLWGMRRLDGIFIPDLHSGREYGILNAGP